MGSAAPKPLPPDQITRSLAREGGALRKLRGSSAGSGGGEDEEDSERPGLLKRLSVWESPNKAA